MLGAEQVHELWAGSEEIVNEDAVHGSLDRMVEEITEKIGDTFPMVLFVMDGVVVFTGMLPPKLAFPFKFDYVHFSHYNNMTVGGEMQWRVAPRESVKGRTVLAFDDILDEGKTIAAIRLRIIDMGAVEFYSAVFCEKTFAGSKPLYFDFCGSNAPDRYVFGCGVNAKGYWCNLSTIHALKNT